MWVTLRQASSLSPQTYLNFKKSGKKKERKKKNYEGTFIPIIHLLVNSFSSLETRAKNGKMAKRTEVVCTESDSSQ